MTLRNRWVLVYAALFATLSLAVSYFGLAVIETAGFQEFDRTAVSLVNLVLYLVPLATMLMAVQSFRAEGGATDQLFTEPVKREEIVVGKVAGLAGAHALATILGFSFTGVLIGLKAGTWGVASYLVLVAFTLLVGIVFIALASLLTVVSGRTHRAYAVVLMAWFGLVLVFDLVMIGLGFALPEVWANRAALGAVFLNPVDATRVAMLIAVAGKEMFGPAGAQLVRLLGGESASVALLSLVLVGWVVAASSAACVSLRHQDV